MNKIRVIDLLNKIANGEEVPKGIEHNGDLYLWEKNDKTYYSEPNGADLMAYIDIPNELNNEIEIIEEDKKIEKLSLSGYYDKDIQDENTWLNSEETLVIKINELIDELNKLKGGSDANR